MNAQLYTDVKTLMNRALKGWEVSIFGEDGNGRFARFVFPVEAAICYLEILDKSTDQTAYVGLQIHAGTRHVVKDESIRETHGRPDGDQNLKLSLNKLFSHFDISTSAWKYSYRDDPQFDVVLEIDVHTLIHGD